MKVLVVGDVGRSIAFQGMGLALAQAGVQMRFIFRQGAPAVPFLRRHHLPVDELPLRGRFDCQSRKALRQIILSFQPDLVHAYTSKTCWLTIAAQWPRKLSPLIFFRGAIRKPSRLNPADWLIFYSDWVDRYNCLSQAIAESLVKSGIPPGKIATTYYGHKLEWYQSQEPPPSVPPKAAPIRIGMIANYRKIKGMETLVDAAEILTARGLDFELLIAGRDDQNHLKAYLKNHQCRNRVKQLGFVPQAWRLLQTFDCAVVPSLQEGLSQAALEALACGAPLIASNVGGLPEIVVSGVNGILVPPQNPEQLADAIFTVTRDPALQEKFRVQGRRTLQDKFSLEQTRDELLRVYKDVVTCQN